MAHIEICGLTKNFGAFRALRNINISVDAKQFVTFLGPSGCGKTTTLRTLAGFLVPDAGSISVAGEMLSSPIDVVPPEKRRMGMVFQNYAVWPHMSVLENVRFGLRYTNVDRREQAARLEQVLAAVGLQGLEDRHPAQLSGGQQQRVALARSLVVEPSILLLDEPLSNLDAKLRERMRSELKSLQRRTGITFVYVTHDQAEAMALSDRIAVFRNGTVQQVGSPREVYERPANLFVADFMGQVNKISGTVIGRDGPAAVIGVGEHRLAALAPASLDGSAVTIAVRPEALSFAPDSSPAKNNQLKGVVVEATFLGNIVDYQVDVGALVLRVQGERRSFRNVGSEVVLTVPVDDCVVMRDEPVLSSEAANDSRTD
ncbi:MAG TPA: ABC transporter ATP-binding protein [Rhodopila sp.]|nr:ABC transporter ATP-binding protein [Rhodopila sp.]